MYQVLDGGNGNPGFESSYCVESTQAYVTGTDGESYPIAGQCCDSSGGCHRYISTNDDDGCISGWSRIALDYTIEDGFNATTSLGVTFTYDELEAFCASKDLQTCTANCAGTGCYYNLNPVWTGNTC